MIFRNGGLYSVKLIASSFHCWPRAGELAASCLLTAIVVKSRVMEGLFL